ncbi:hypothetical protein M1466_01780 [Candidatus Dependentiae bacterium]|nr:hypothetical protein [Candidatus Dependentiae bacterium]
MNIFDTSWTDRLAKFKQELIAITFLSLMHIWWCFHYPAYMRLAAPWDSIAMVGMSIIGVVAVVLLFTFADKIADNDVTRYYDQQPYAYLFKAIRYLSFVFVALFFWYADIFHLPAAYYGILAFNLVIASFLFEQAQARKIHSM